MVAPAALSSPDPDDEVAGAILLGDYGDVCSFGDRRMALRDKMRSEPAIGHELGVTHVPPLHGSGEDLRPRFERVGVVHPGSPSLGSCAVGRTRDCRTDDDLTLDQDTERKMALATLSH